MKEINLETLQMISGGGWMDGFCAALGVTSGAIMVNVGYAAIARTAAWAISPPVAIALGISTLACVAREVYKLP